MNPPRPAARVFLREPEAADQRAFTAAARSSLALHRPWVKAPQDAAAYRAYLQRVCAADALARLVVRRDSGAIAGAMHLSHIVMGNFRSAYLGYYAFAGHERQGLMHEGLLALLRLAFGTLKLHRVEANIQPDNTASIALVRRCGFQFEGRSPRYLKIGGRWRDHERWAVLAR